MAKSLPPTSENSLNLAKSELEVALRLLALVALGVAKLQTQQLWVKIPAEPIRKGQRDGD